VLRNSTQNGYAQFKFGGIRSALDEESDIVDIVDREGVSVRAIFTDEARACRKKHRTTTRSQARIDRSLDVGSVIRDAITLGAKCRIFHIEID
jgi:hypothetical protein